VSLVDTDAVVGLTLAGAGDAAAGSELADWLLSSLLDTADII